MRIRDMKVQDYRNLARWKHSNNKAVKVAKAIYYAFNNASYSGTLEDIYKCLNEETLNLEVE